MDNAYRLVTERYNWDCFCHTIERLYGAVALGAGDPPSQHREAPRITTVGRLPSTISTWYR